MRLALALFAVFALSLRADDTVSVASLLKDATDFNTLPMHRNWRVNLASSHDPTGGNADAQQFLSKDGDHAVLADLKGPGAIVRFWSTAVYKDEKGNLTSAPSGWLKVFIDDNPKPVIDESFADFFGKNEPFTKPLTEHYGPATISYFPIPYARHCLVTLDKPQDQFYQIQSIAFPEGTKVRPFALPLTAADQKALEISNKRWTEISRETFGFPCTDWTLAPAETRQIKLPPGPGAVIDLDLHAPKVTNNQLRNLILRAWFDDHTVPDIEAPVADFFGCAFGTIPFKSFFLAQEGGFYDCTFHMPYGSKAHFSIENRNSVPVELTLEPQVSVKPFKTGTEYFHADFNQEITKSGRAHVWLKVAKEPGHFVGVVQTMQGNQTLGYCEGDEQVRVDEQEWGKSTKNFPNTVVGPWNGTGTEDCFNSAWYFGDGLVSRPMNATLVREDLGRINTLRFFVNDAPVWHDSIEAQIEHGGTNDGDGLYYSSVAYWYGPGERQPMEPFPSDLSFPVVNFVDGNSGATVIEGESLVGTATCIGGKVEKQKMKGFLNAWSGDAQLSWSGAKPNDTLGLTVNIPIAGTYHIIAYVGHGPDYGVTLATLAGQPLKRNDNAYAAGEPQNVRQDWGTAELPAGPCKITIKMLAAGKENGTRYGLDFLDLHLTKKSK